MNSNTLAKNYWHAFIQSNHAKNVPPQTTYQAWSFGDSTEMANDLATLVLLGQKTATASLGWVYEKLDETMPMVEEYNIILDGEDLPVCITKTTEVITTPFNQVSPKFAFDEGEGDRSLEYWRKVHWDFFSRECKQIKMTITEDMPIVCERFIRVFPFDDSQNSAA